MALQLDNSGLPLDPATLQQIQEANLMKSVAEGGGSAADRLTAETVGRGVNTLFPNLAMRQAQQAQQALAGAGALQQADGESDLDFSIRQVKAQRDALGPVDQHAADARNTQLLKLLEQKFQQQHLTAGDDRQAQSEADLHAERQATLEKLNHRVLMTPDGKTLGTFDTGNEDQARAYAAARQASPTAVSLGEEAYAAHLDKLAEIRARAAEAQAAKANALAATGVDPADANYYAAQYATGAAGRMTARERAVAIHAMNTSGVTLGDQFAARADITALTSGARAIGQRQANISTIENSLGSLGDQATASVAGLNNGDLATLNKWLNAGKAELSSGPVYRSYLAVQALRTEYARLLRGGTAPDDQAMREAAAVIPNNVSAKAMGDVVDQIRRGEVPALQHGSDLALDAYTSPAKWKGLIALSQKLGIPVDDLVSAGRDGSAPPSAPGAAAPPAAAPAQSAAPPKVVDFSSLK